MSPGLNVDSASFRHVLGHFASGVVVVTAMHEGEPVGMTAQSFSALSMDPPLVMFCPARISTTWPKIQKAGGFAINILSHEQESVGRQFAQSANPRFSGIDWHTGISGAPLLTGVLAQIDCRPWAVYDGGDHDIIVGEVLQLAADPDLEPLVFFRSDFGNFQPRA